MPRYSNLPRPSPASLEASEGRGKAFGEGEFWRKNLKWLCRVLIFYTKTLDIHLTVIYIYYKNEHKKKTKFYTGCKLLAEKKSNVLVGRF